jgi:hypothetical protein
MKRLFILTGILVLLLASTAAADPGDTLWTRTYGGGDLEEGWCVQQTHDGGYIIAGHTASFGAGNYDVYVVKTATNGDTVWTRSYGGGATDMGFFVQQTSDGGYIIAGQTESFGAGSYDVWLIKTDANGDTLWTRTYGGGDNDKGFSVQQTSDGGYIIVGYTCSFGAGTEDVYLVRTDSSGDTLWTHTYGRRYDDYGRSVQQTSDGGYIIAGYTESFGAGATDVYLLKTDSSGDTLWTRTYGGDQRDYGWEVVVTPDGGFAVAAHTASFGAGRDDVYLVKTDASGDSLWTRTYGGSLLDHGFSLQHTSDGGYVVAGYTNSFGAGGYDLYVVKTDANGDILWTRTYGGSGYDYARSVRQTTDGGYIVAGYTESFGAGGYDVYLVKLAGEGPEPDVSIEIVPDDPPVTVPRGGSFGFTGRVTNNTEDPQTTDVWIMAAGPSERVHGPFKEFENIPLAPSQSRTRHLNQIVPNGAPLGFYSYIAYCGDYPSMITDSSYFRIEVVRAEGSGGSGWVLTGSFLEGDLADIPFDFALLSNYPNPFNASTLISYELPADTHVKLEVYNISGQKVATLVDSKQYSGYRSVVWDASEVSSGLYFYKLTAGDFAEVKRMTLLR